MSNQVKNIPFDNGELLGVRTDDGQVWLAIRKACRNIGLTDKQADNELQKIKGNLLYNTCTSNLGWRLLNLKIETQAREIFVLNEKFVPMWLAQIRLTPKMQKSQPDTIHRLLKYQLEAVDVLHKAFYETNEKKEILHRNLNLTGKFDVMTVQINNIEFLIEEQTEMLTTVMDNLTLSTRQQQKIFHAAKDRINLLLGGAHSQYYKSKSKTYFINLWNDLKKEFECASYKDLNPRYFGVAIDFISEWAYKDVA